VPFTTLDLVDAIWVSIAPVLFGTGKRYFDDLGRHVRLEDPEVFPGRRALHLRGQRSASSGGS
jgi:dihydrofolate reductase